MKKYKILFANFSMNEKTLSLSKFSALKNIDCDYIEFDQDVKFYQKLNMFIEKCSKMEYDLFIRSDADRIIMPGINEIIELSKKNFDKELVFEGTGYEYIMNRKRNATPNVYTIRALEYFRKNNILSENVLKPESSILAKLGSNFKSIQTNQITNIHEYGLDKNRIFNCFLQRIKRNHIGYYDFNYIRNSLPPHYQEAIFEAIEYHKNNLLQDRNNFVYVKKINELKKDNLKSKKELEMEYLSLTKRYLK